MTDSQPIAISHFKLPVDEQLFFRLTEIFWVFKMKYDYLTIALAGLQDPNGPDTLDPKVKDLLDPLRRLTSDRVTSMIMLMRCIREFSRSFIVLVNAAPVTDAGKDITVVNNLIRDANGALGHWKAAKEQWDQLSHEVVSTTEKISAVVGNDGSGASIFTEENSRAVNEIIHAAKEGCTITGSVYQYLQDTLDHFKDEALIKYPPSKEEIDMMWERWTKFLKNMESFDFGYYSEIHVEMVRSPDIKAARADGEFWRDRVGDNSSTSARQNAPTKPQKAIVDANTPDEESAPPSIPVEPKPSFFRTLLRRILSCIFFKRFARYSNHQH